MGRFERSLLIFKTSWKILMKDKELLVLPLVSGTIIVVLCLLFALGMGLFGHEARVSTAMAIPGFLLYVVMYTVSIFFQAALVFGANERMSGGDPTIGSSLRGASKHLGKIVLWGLVAGTVGAILRAIEDKSEVVGRIVAGILGFAWSIATVFVVPVIVLEDLTFGASVKRSWGLFKETWGETAIGNIGLGLIAFIATLVVFGVAAGIGMLFQSPLVGFLIGAVGLTIVMVFTAALQGIYAAGLYRYATTKEAPDGFEAEQMERVFG